MKKQAILALGLGLLASCVLYQKIAQAKVIATKKPGSYMVILKIGTRPLTGNFQKLKKQLQDLINPKTTEQTAIKLFGFGFKKISTRTAAQKLEALEALHETYLGQVKKQLAQKEEALRNIDPEVRSQKAALQDYEKQIPQQQAGVGNLTNALSIAQQKLNTLQTSADSLRKSIAGAEQRKTVLAREITRLKAILGL